MTFIDEHKDRTDGGRRWGVESICRVLTAQDLPIAPATYYAAKTCPPSPRTVRDAKLLPVLAKVHAENYGVYGARKMQAALRRHDQPVTIGRDQAARLMRDLGLKGVRRGKSKRTTIADDTAPRPTDLVDRNFHADRPDQLWVVDLTYIRTWVGFAYLALVTNVYSVRIVGWALTTHMRTDLPLEALEMAIWTRRRHGVDDLTGLIHHGDRGSVYLSIQYTERLAKAGVVASVGSKGDSYDNALAASTFGQIEAELIHRRRPWRTVDSSSTPCSSTSTGGTIAACTARPDSSRPPKRKPPTTLNHRHSPRPTLNETASTEPRRFTEKVSGELEFTLNWPDRGPHVDDDTATDWPRQTPTGWLARTLIPGLLSSARPRLILCRAWSNAAHGGLSNPLTVQRNL